MSNLATSEKLEGLKMRYAIGLPGKVSKAVETVGAFLAVPRNRVLLEVAHRVIHSLTGSSGTYGFFEISRVARDAEAVLCESLESGLTPSPERELHLREQIYILGLLAGAAAAAPEAAEAE